MEKKSGKLLALHPK